MPVARRRAARRVLGIEQRRRSLGRLLMLVIPITLLFMLFNAYIGHFQLAAFELACVMLLMVPAALLNERSTRVGLGENLLMLAASLILLYVLYDGGVADQGIVWLLSFPFIAFYVAGMLQGWIWSLGFALGVSLFLALRLGATASYSGEDWMLFVVAYLFYFSIAYISNNIRINYQASLEEQVDRRFRQIRHLALFNPVTDLPNRTYLDDKLAAFLKNPEIRTLAVLSIDIDRFFQINESFGFNYGDALLRELGQRIQAHAREHDFVAHLGRDEFAMLLPGMDEKGAVGWAERLKDSLEESYNLGETQLDIETSLGLSLYEPEGGRNVSQLMRHANEARRIAKRQKHGVAVYCGDVDSMSARHLKLFGDLRRGINSGELRLHYQPKVRADSRHVCGVEVLVRWRHPEEGMISPGEFVPIAENTGIINALTLWVIDEAMRQQALWRKQRITVDIAINLSVRNLTDPELVPHVRELLFKHRLTARNILFEVTESALMEYPEITLQTVRALREMGFRLALDDFGTGHSSLGYLKQLPISELKVDQCFVRDILHSQEDRAIVRSTIDMAHSLKLKVVAEGVESADVWEALLPMGCDTGQGFYFAKPMSAELFEEWLSASSWGMVRAA